MKDVRVYVIVADSEEYDDQHVFVAQTKAECIVKALYFAVVETQEAMKQYTQVQPIDEVAFCRALRKDNYVDWGTCGGCQRYTMYCDKAQFST